MKSNTPTDTAALVARWQEIADRAEAVIGPMPDEHASELMNCGDDLASALEASLAREAALVEALELLAAYIGAQGVSISADDSQRARAALKGSRS